MAGEQAPVTACSGSARDASQLRGVIDDGEREAIALAVEVRADALLMDDRDGRREAKALNCPVLGNGARSL